MAAVNSKYWGILLPVPTIIAILNSLFWIWLFIHTVGLEPPKTTESENAVIEQF